MVSLTFGLFTQVSGSGPLGPLVLHHLGWKVFVIRLLYKTFKEKLKIQGKHPTQLCFGFTTTCIMIVYKNIMKSCTN